MTAVLEKVRRLERYLVHTRGYTDEAFDRTVDKLLQREREQVESQLTRLQERISEFEKQYGWPTPEFYNRFEKGELGDEADFFEWSALWKMVQELQQGLKLLS